MHSLAETLESSLGSQGQLAVFMGLSAQAPVLGAVSTHELVRKDQLKELERVAGSDEQRMDEYASYVLLPLLLLFGTIVLLRRSMLP
ncbi:MAG: hypothetical protein Q8M07_22180 [Prosthecobacter sp.]|nr:hypothetical protein [Prosthecobacter sp.]